MSWLYIIMTGILLGKKDLEVLFQAILGILQWLWLFMMLPVSIVSLSFFFPSFFSFPYCNLCNTPLQIDNHSWIHQSGLRKFALNVEVMLLLFLLAIKLILLIKGKRINLWTYNKVVSEFYYNIDFSLFRQVSIEEGDAKAREVGVMFIETSAKAGFNIKVLLITTYFSINVRFIYFSESWKKTCFLVAIVSEDCCFITWDGNPFFYKTGRHGWCESETRNKFFSYWATRRRLCLLGLSIIAVVGNQKEKKKKEKGKMK